MKEELMRTELLFGSEGMEKLKNAKVALFGVGGVGGYVAEALARSGVGNMVLTDNDCVSVSNINRQIIALHSTVGRPKVEVMKERLLDINPEINLELHRSFYLPENHDDYDFASYDYVIDCIDTVAAKIDLVLEAQKAGTPIIASMGTGNKHHPELLEVSDIFKTSVCPLARVIRQECKKRRIKRLKVVFSTEEAAKIPPERYALCPGESKGTAGRPVPASVSFVPPVAGFILAGEVIKDLTEGLR